jgi:hypothetical protein
MKQLILRPRKEVPWMAGTTMLETWHCCISIQLPLSMSASPKRLQLAEAIVLISQQNGHTTGGKIVIYRV